MGNTAAPSANPGSIESTGSSHSISDALVIAVLGAAFFTTVSVNYVISPVLPVIADAFRVSIGTAALLVSAYSLVYGCSAVLLGPVGDHAVRKTMMVVSLAAFVVFTFLCGVAQSFGWLVVFRAGAGMAAATMQPATWAYLADYFPYERRGTATAWVMQAGSLALILGVPIGGLISEVLSWRWIFYVASLLGVIVVAIVITKLPAGETWSRTPISSVRELAIVVRRTFGSVLVHGVARWSLIVSLLIWLGFFGQYTYIGAFLVHRFDLNSAQIGFVTLTVGLGYVLGGQVGGRLSDRIGRRAVVLAGLGWLAVSLLLLPHVNNLALAALVILSMGFGFFFTYSAQVTFITELLPRSRSTMMAINYFFTYLGLTLGSTLGGLVLEWRGFPLLGVMSALSCVLAGLVARTYVFRVRGTAGSGG